MTDDRPYPPGEYPVVIVGSGPGGLQLSRSLSELGVRHAVISQDPSAGGMFRRFPFFQRLLSWTKPYAPCPRTEREYERYDWNSLVSEDVAARAIMPDLMDGTSYFPSRPEMERNLVAFAERAGVSVRYGCRWEGTRADGGAFVLTTSDGEYRCRFAVFAVGVAEPWRPETPGIELATHYADTREAHTYADREVFIVGKENSAFELASGFLQWAKRIVLASPSPAKLSVTTNSLVGVRARYVQPYEDNVLGGGVLVLNASIQEVARTGERFTVKIRRSNTNEEQVFEADDVIAATGWIPPLRDLPKLGVVTFGRNRLPALTPFWESVSLKGVYFAGTITQAAAGLKKNGIPANSGGVNGHRYNGRVLARHLARSHFGVEIPRPKLRAADVSGFLLHELDHGPEMWHQRSYLCRVVSVTPADGVRDEGIWPLAHFVDSEGPDAVAATIEANAQGDNYPAFYIRRGGRVTEHLLDPDQRMRYDTPDRRSDLAAILRDLVGSEAAA
ncbi:MAG: NAD(P)-binding domain-containing protein [Chloroflexi bacterium]|nr:NAD(P)-binding domain-containing protein [Chloroflexota bacterium]